MCTTDDSYQPEHPTCIMQVSAPLRNHLSGMPQPNSASTIPTTGPQLVGGVIEKLLTQRGVVAGASDTGGGVAADLEGRGEGKVWSMSGSVLMKVVM